MYCKKTKTGDLMQVRECIKNDVTYGVIVIKLKNRHSSLHEAGHVLMEFMRQLQSKFVIQHSTGISIENRPAANQLLVTDYWQDMERLDWKVRGWTDGKTIAVLYVKNIGCQPVGLEEAFLNGRLFAAR